MAVFMARTFTPPEIVYKGPVAVTIEGYGQESGNKYVKVGGTTYYESASGIEVWAGDTIYLSAGYATQVSGGNYKSIIIIDGETVAGRNNYGSAGTCAKYTWTVPEGIKAILIKFDGTYRQITVTTTAA